MRWLVLTAVYSRHTFVWLTHSQTLAAVITGCEAAWEFFGGVFAVLIPDNMKALVTQAHKLEPQLGRGWLDYAQHAGFVTDTARVRTPTDKPRVERTIHFVQNNFWAGENFTSLPEALRALDATETNDFYELVVERQTKTTIITSNRKPAEWLTMTTDALLAQSAIDRLTSRAHTLVIEGPSYRQRDRARLDGRHHDEHPQ